MTVIAEFGSVLFITLFASIVLSVVYVWPTTRCSRVSDFLTFRERKIFPYVCFFAVVFLAVAYFAFWAWLIWSYGVLA